MMVAWHEMPGMCHPEARPVGYGMNGWRDGAIVSIAGQGAARQTTPFPTGRIMCTLTRHFMPGYPRFVPTG